MQLRVASEGITFLRQRQQGRWDMADVTPTEEFLDGAGDLKIFMRSWRPSTGPRGVIVISHGFNSHSGQFSMSRRRNNSDRVGERRALSDVP